MRKSLIKLAENGEWNTLQKAVAILDKRFSTSRSKKMNNDELIVWVFTLNKTTLNKTF